MSVWEVLEIEPTSDSRAIKRAYAKQVKSIRPDEQPTEFQNLHASYKSALNQASFANFSEANNSESSDTKLRLDDVFGAVALEEHAASNSNLAIILDEASVETPVEEENETEEAVVDDLQLVDEQPIRSQIALNNVVLSNSPAQEQEALIAELKHYLASSPDRLDFKTWDFLADSDYALDTEFNFYLGVEVLSTILAHNETHNTVDKTKDQVLPGAFAYLDDYFHWSGQIEPLEYELGKGAAENVQSLIETGRRTIRKLASNTDDLGVRGGLVLLQNELQAQEQEVNRKQTREKRDQRNQDHEVAEAKNSLLTYSVFIAVFCCFISGLILYNLDADQLSLFLVYGGVGISALSIFMCYGINGQSKIAYSVLAVIALIALFFFPIGTIIGVRMLITLYNARSEYFFTGK